MARNPGQTEGDNHGQSETEVSELLPVEDDVHQGSMSETEEVPDFSELFEEAESKSASSSTDVVPDSEREHFHVPEKTFEQPKPYFEDKKFYQKVLTGEGDAAKRLHSQLAAFLNAADSKERSAYRSRIITAFWEVASNIARKIDTELPLPKTLFLRFAALLPTILSPEQRRMIASVVFENQTGEPIYYVDEWLKAVSRGRVNPSAVDETKTAGKKDAERVNALLEKTRGKYQSQLTVIRNRSKEIEEQEKLLRERADFLSRHEPAAGFDDLKAPYTEEQRAALGEMTSILRNLGNLNKELGREYRELETITEQLEGLEEKEREGGSAVDSKTVVREMQTVRQMAKLAIGRQGNHFPILMKQYFRNGFDDMGTRENVIKVLAEVEHLDPGVFERTFKRQTNRIVPNIVLVPCYGDQGICWEPFERFNRATSRSRLAVPMYPKDLRSAVIAAAGDLRWQVAKEKAQHYWMEEGLTGWYYQWFADRRMKGDVKDAFVQDYVLWITRESEGTQKLDREVRDIFWRYIPFPQDVKDKLKNRGFVYDELYKKDRNRSLSDGY
ncbi:MAG: hypothetical protein ACLFM5_06750 [Spirochaetaceae bacterium]